MTYVLMIALTIGAVVAYVALRNAKDFSDANEIIPGVDTGAPKSWAGAHNPEAKLHRRLRDACEALRINASLDDPALQSVRTDLEDQAVAVDRQLVAVAALPAGRRQQPLEQVTQAVEAIEGAVADVVALRGPNELDVADAIDAVRTRVGLVAEARAELDALTAPTPDLDELRRRLGDEPVAEPTEGPVVEEPGPDEPRPEPGV